MPRGWAVGMDILLRLSENGIAGVPADIRKGSPPLLIRQEMVLRADDQAMATVSGAVCVMAGVRGIVAVTVTSGG